MKEIKVLWSHADDPTIPPLVCTDTGRTVREVVADFRKDFNGDKFHTTYSEEIIPDSKDNCNRLTIDGTALEDLVPLPDPSKYCGMVCDGCGTENSGGPASCSRIYEQVPESVLRLALSKATERRTD